MVKQLKLMLADQEESESREILIDVVYSNRKTLGLEVNGEGRVCLRAPRRASSKVVWEFVNSKRAWIIEKYFLMEKRRKEMAERGVPDYIKNPALEKLYRQRAKEQLQHRTSYFAKKMGVSYGKITVRAAKTRWGSCSVQGNLNFHWKLILMPAEVLDYVVVHELAHRKEMNHSSLFWAEVERILPDYRERRKWLKTYGQTV